MSANDSLLSASIGMLRGLLKAAIRLATVSQKMKSRPGKAAITVPNENRYVVKRPRVEIFIWLDLKAQRPAPRSQHERLFIRYAILWWVCTDMAMKVSIELS